MRANKNTHLPRPSIENSFRKSERIYPKPQRFGEMVSKSATSQSPNVTKMIDQFVKQDTHHLQKHPIIIMGKSDMGMKKYHFLCKDPFPIRGTHGNDIVTDTNCLWYHALENPIFDKAERTIQFISSELVFSNWTEQQYPNVFYITMDGMMGYYDSQSKVTDRIAVMELSEVSPVYESANLISYSLRYSFSKKNIQQWTIPVGITAIILRLKRDSQDDYERLPLQHDMPIQFIIKNK